MIPPARGIPAGTTFMLIEILTLYFKIRRGSGFPCRPNHLCAKFIFGRDDHWALHAGSAVLGEKRNPCGRTDLCLCAENYRRDLSCVHARRSVLPRSFNAHLYIRSHFNRKRRCLSARCLRFLFLNGHFTDLSLHSEKQRQGRQEQHHQFNERCPEYCIEYHPHLWAFGPAQAGNCGCGNRNSPCQNGGSFMVPFGDRTKRSRQAAAASSSAG